MMRRRNNNHNSSSQQQQQQQQQMILSLEETTTTTPTEDSNTTSNTSNTTTNNHNNHNNHQNDFVSWLLQDWLIPSTLIVSIVCAQVPLSISAALAAIGLTCFAFVTIPYEELEQVLLLVVPVEQEHHSQEQKQEQAQAQAKAQEHHPHAQAQTHLQHQHQQQHQQQQQQLPSPVTFIMAVIGIVSMIGSLLFDNFMVWFVSATYPDGQIQMNSNQKHTIHPLQDNGQLVLQYLLSSSSTSTSMLQLSKSSIVHFRHSLNVQWCLVACLGSSFVVVDVLARRKKKKNLRATTSTSSGILMPTKKKLTLKDHQQQQQQQQQQVLKITTKYDETLHYRTLYSLSYRAVLTLALARLIRAISFTLTVLPSQIDNCYSKRGYPYPPPKIGSYLFVQTGLIPNTKGGCNDLIISGHATVTSTIACVVSSVVLMYSSSRTISTIVITILWCMIVLDYTIEIYEGYHYSVDMWLGLVIVVLIWNSFESLEQLNYNNYNYNNNNNFIQRTTAAGSITSSNNRRKNYNTNNKLATITFEEQDQTVYSPHDNNNNDNSNNDNDDDDANGSSDYGNNPDSVSVSPLLAISHQQQKELSVGTVEPKWMQLPVFIVVPTIIIIVLYTIPAIIAYMFVLHIFPKRYGNVCIVSYTFIAAVLGLYGSYNAKHEQEIITIILDDNQLQVPVLRQQKPSRQRNIRTRETLINILQRIPSDLIMHYTQHVFLCLLYITFGIYL